MHFKNDIKSLYIHVPFCSSKCSYCDFFSVENSSFSIKKDITDSTAEQLKFFSGKYCLDNIETVYIGGGTPTALPLSLLEKLILTVSDVLKKEISEFSIEVNPETVNKDLITFFRDTPLTRISTGIQSFNDVFLNILGRKSSFKTGTEALNLLKITDLDINIDLISSIPGQKIDDCINDLKTALSFDPDHISLYNLTIEENTPIADIYSSKDIDDEVWIQSSGFLSEYGYDHYEISNFSKSGKKCLHNLNYWRMEPYIGCGPTAVSTMFSNDSAFRLKNCSDFNLFLERGKNNWNISEENISDDDFLIETLMMGFRTSEGICREKIRNIFGFDLYGIIPETIIKWINREMLIKTEKNLVLSEKGRLFHSSFIIDIMNELENRKKKLS